MATTETLLLKILKLSQKKTLEIDKIDKIDKIDRIEPQERLKLSIFDELSNIMNSVSSLKSNVLHGYSVINYGLPNQIGVYLSDDRLLALESQVRHIIQDLEPRLEHVEVHITKNGSNAMSIHVLGDMIDLNLTNEQKAFQATFSLL